MSDTTVTVRADDLERILVDFAGLAAATGDTGYGTEYRDRLRDALGAVGEGEITTRADIESLAEELAARVRASSQVGAGVWADALDWFARRVHGGQRSVIAQKEFDHQFGPAAPEADRG